MANDAPIVDPTTIEILTPPTHGSTMVDPATGQIEYLPNTDFRGLDSLTYTAQNSSGQDLNHVVVHIDVRSAIDDSFIVLANESTQIDVLANDFQGLDPGTLTIIDQPRNGEVTVDRLTGIVTYTPHDDKFGPNWFTYSISDRDGNVSNVASVLVDVRHKLTWKSPTSGGELPPTVSVIGGVVLDMIGVNGFRVVSQLPATSLFKGFFDLGSPHEYRGNPGTIGIQDGFDATLVDVLGGGLSELAVRITLWDGDTSYDVNRGLDNFDRNGQNFLLLNDVTLGDFSDVPTIETNHRGGSTNQRIYPNSHHGFRNETLDTGFFFTNDETFLDPFFATLASGQVIYQLYDVDVWDNYFDFTYGVDSELEKVGQIPNVLPMAVDDAAATSIGAAIEIDVLANDQDADGSLIVATVQVVAGSGPANGAVSIDPSTGRITYEPAVGFEGIDTFQYVVTDNNGAVSNAATVTINVDNSVLNDVPIITGQVVLATPEETTLAITLADLTVVDPDNLYPDDFTLSVLPGSNYTVSGNTITPAVDFNGTLTVPVQVDDGSDLSDAFDLIVEVIPVNDIPVITDQVVLATPEETALAITLAHLTVVDPDNVYPDDFTLSVLPGTSYTVSGHTITPAVDFNGTLTVPVQVDDGTDTSDAFELSVEVTPVNDIPVITDQVVLATPEETALAITLADLTVVDPDNVYPDDFTLSVLPGTSYTVSGNTITPAVDFNGTLTVPVQVDDGTDLSDAFDLIVAVTPVNDLPLITDQVVLSTLEETALTIALADLTVLDPDNLYPDDFTLTIIAGHELHGQWHHDHTGSGLQRHPDRPGAGG